jgi:hypothetical protein
MKFYTKLILSALGIALLATPALAQRPVRHMQYPSQTQIQVPVGTYPNPVARSGSAEQAESGAAFNTGY